MNVGALRIRRSSWRVAVNLQVELAAFYIGFIWHKDRKRVAVAISPDPKLAPPAITVTQYDLWLHPLPVIGLHLVIWRVGS